MIDMLKIRKVMRSPIAALSLSDVVFHWENRDSDMVQGKVHVFENLLPVQEFPAANKTIQFDGIYQLLVVTQKGAGTEAVETLRKQLGDYYGAGSSLTVAGAGCTTIKRTEPNAPYDYLPSAGAGSWRAFPLSINFLAFNFS